MIGGGGEKLLLEEIYPNATEGLFNIPRIDCLFVNSHCSEDIIIQTDVQGVSFSFYRNLWHQNDETTTQKIPSSSPSSVNASKALTTPTSFL